MERNSTWENTTLGLPVTNVSSEGKVVSSGRMAIALILRLLSLFVLHVSLLGANHGP